MTSPLACAALRVPQSQHLQTTQFGEPMTNQASAKTLPRPDTQRAKPEALWSAGEKTFEFVMQPQPVRGSDFKNDLVHIMRPKVMIVDDEPINIEVLQDFLQEAGYGRFVSTDKSETALAVADST